MTWTYGADPAASTTDAVRFLVGDTVLDDPLIQDEEIAWAIAENANIYAAAAQVAESIAAYFARQASMVKIGPIWEQSNNRAKDYREMAQTLKIRAISKTSLNITAGGTDLTLVSDERAPLSIGMHDRENS
jgi:hypothetical protein